VASKYDKLTPGESIAIFLEEVALIADVDKLDETANSVTLMTVHSAKGLEFDTVFLIGLEEGIFPHTRSLLEKDELEEERRLMYVAITRAKEKIYLLNTRNRLLYGESQSNAPSQFIKEIPEDLLETAGLKSTSSWSPNIESKYFNFKPLPDENNSFKVISKSAPVEASSPRISLSPEFKDGDRVEHETFGEGTVISLKGGVATICFKSKKYGIKKLALSVAPIKKLI
jgi:DNA helicase-2/ATP-dependent DNA helicase PcrA